VKWVTERIPRH